MPLYHRSETTDAVSYQFPYALHMTALTVLFIVSIPFGFVWGPFGDLISFGLFLLLCALGLLTSRPVGESRMAKRNGYRVWSTGSRFSLEDPLTIHIAKKKE